jgi:hypothetical protein
MSQVRVYELAKELGVESKLLLSMIKDLRGFVRSASSTIDPRLEQRLRAAVAARGFRPPRRLAEGSSKRSPQAEEPALHPDVLKPWSGAPRKVRDRRPRTKPEERSRPDEWASAWFTAEEKNAWQSVGMFRPGDAVKCIEKKLRPEDMLRRIGSRHVGEMIASGEPVAVVVRLIQEEQRRTSG